VVLTVTDKQEPTADETAKNFDATREQLLSQQREEIFGIFMGTLTQRYEQGGGVRLTKQAAAPAGPLTGK
jgi:peptidyl-prolyl cis-trans isomerase D